jgi:hypothetical protein
MFKRRGETGPTKRPRPLHPFLFAAVPVLALWVQNLSEGVSLRDVAKPLLVTVAAAGVVMLIAGLLLRGNFRKGGLVAAAVIFLVFSYGPLSSLVGAPAPVILGSCLALCVAAIVAIVRATPQRVTGLTRGLNLVAAGLVAVNAVSIGFHESRARDIGVDTSGVLSGAAKGSTPFGRPDVYFIVLDDYGGERALRELLGYDNRPFLDALAARGFYVPAHPTTNYPRTSWFLASTLNLQYLQSLIPAGTTITEGNLRPLIMGDAVPKFFKSKGYRYVHIGSWVEDTATNPQADVNVTLGRGLSSFSNALLNETAFKPALEAFGTLDWDRQQYDRAIFQFDQLAKSKELAGPKFVFAHIIVPHWPYVFGEDGGFSDAQIKVSEIKAPLDSVSATARQRYVMQIEFANQKALALIDTLLSGPPDSRPAIVLQSDEGFFTWLTDGGNASDQDLEQHFNVLSAYYLPRLANTGLYPTITPVNSFRLLFNDYFQAALPLLPDRNYVLADQQNGYRFIDVTERVLLVV